MPPAKARASRTLTGSRPIVPFVRENVSDAADRLQGMPSERAVDLLPEVADVDVDDVRVALVGDVPGVLEQLLAREHDAGVVEEHPKERELLRGERDGRPTPPDLVRGGVEDEVAHA